MANRSQAELFAIHGGSSQPGHANKKPGMGCLWALLMPWPLAKVCRDMAVEWPPELMQGQHRFSLFSGWIWHMTMRAKKSPPRNS